MNCVHVPTVPSKAWPWPCTSTKTIREKTLARPVLTIWSNKLNPLLTVTFQHTDSILRSLSECTARPECRCPEGYFKTRDGTECLKFSEEEANCIDAERACSADFNSRLAIAKDQERLDKIATIMDGTFYDQYRKFN